MSPEEFSVVVEKIRPHTDYIYLHVLGEPLLHPQLDKILSIAGNAGLNVNITTNGALIGQKQAILLNHTIRQMNISLHDAEENISHENLDNYLNTVLDFAKTISPKTYISLRLWNSTNAESESFNLKCLEKISEKFAVTVTDLQKVNNLKLSDHIFLQKAPRFTWPDENGEKNQDRKTCYALRDHVAILSDGQVVPCCLDADANMKLGDIFTEDLSDILRKDKTISIKKGFEQRKIVEPLCATCGFIID